MFYDDSILEKFSLKYDGEVPKGYDVSEMEYTFEFIYLVLKRDASIDGALRGVANEYGLSEGYLRDYLIDYKYILAKSDADEFALQIKKYNTKTLKKILKKHGLKTSGKRDRIEQRIFENRLIGNEYYLSSKSKVFYKNKKRRFRIFNQYLADYYYFDEFNEFYMDNYRKKEAKIPIEFINQHINKSVEDKNHKNFTFNSYIMAQHFFDKENFKKMLEYVLKVYCMNLNPVWKIDELDNHGGFSKEIYDCLIFLQGKLGRNIVINTYYLVWDSFNFDKLIMSKYEGYRCLKDILNYKDYNKIVRDLKNRYYANDDLKIKKITQKTLFDF